MLTFAFFSVDAFVALALVEVRGMTPAEAGIALTAATVTWTGGSWVQATERARWPTVPFVRGGFAVATASGWPASCWSLFPRRPVAGSPIPTFALAGFGMGLAYSPLALIVLREARRPIAGLGVERAVADRLARDRARDRASAGAIVAAASARPASRSSGLAIAFAVASSSGLGGFLAGVWLPAIAARAAFAAPPSADGAAAPSAARLR